jgi:hypothetical protein
MAETRAPSAASITVECELAYDQEVGVDVERGAIESACGVAAASGIAENTEIDGLADDVSDVFLIVVFVDANEYH